LAAKTEEEVKAAFAEHGSSYASNFVPERVSDVLLLIRHRKFPKKKDAQINFLADSLGGRPELSLRRSRDICEKERAKQRQKSKHKIIRNEFYIECTCGYQGPALDNACPKCGAEIPVSIFGRTGTVPSRQGRVITYICNVKQPQPTEKQDDCPYDWTHIRGSLTFASIRGFDGFATDQPCFSATANAQLFGQPRASPNHDHERLDGGHHRSKQCRPSGRNSSY